MHLGVGIIGGEASWGVRGGGWEEGHFTLYVIVQSFNHVQLFEKFHGLQHTRFLCPPLSPRVYSNSCALNQ